MLRFYQSYTIETLLELPIAHFYYLAKYAYRLTAREGMTAIVHADFPTMEKAQRKQILDSYILSSGDILDSDATGTVDDLKEMLG